MYLLFLFLQIIRDRLSILHSTLYNWRNPIGFVVVVIHQTFWSCIVLDFIICAFFFFCAMCLCVIDCSADINCTFDLLNKAVQRKNLAVDHMARIEFKQMFNKIIEFHATSIE